MKPLPDDPDALLTKKEFQEYLDNVGDTLFDQMLRDGLLPTPSLLVGKNKLWRAGRIRAWVQDRERQAEREASDASSESLENARNRSK